MIDAFSGLTVDRLRELRAYHMWTARSAPHPLIAKDRAEIARMVNRAIVARKMEQAA